MDPDLQALGKSFARQLKAEGKAERTRVLYGQSIDFYARWLTTQGEPTTTASLTRRLIRDWLADLTDGHAPATVKTRYRGLFRFCGWCVAEDEIEANPMKGLAPPSIPSAPVPVLTDADLTALLRACRGKEFHQVRDTAMLRLLLDCGLRVSELCGLTVDGTDLDNEYALVTGKGSKVRPVYFGAQTSAAVDKYLRR
ncbi:MAG: tyrosine-type recombinase/integrase, partial [Ornithinimicrobium sp.]|uniref:tyrosine-type recombinase/integrase n=1 Tax=Ornithinimicrobium sp. TaxID=1977084 RepID=UPI003D9B81D1